MELCRSQEVDKDSRFVKKLKPTLYTLIAMTWLVLLPVTFWRATAGNVLADVVRYGSVIFFFIGFLVLSVWYGTNIRAQLKGMSSPQTQSLRNRVSIRNLKLEFGGRIDLRKITVYIVSLPVIFLGIFMCGFALIKGAAYHKYPYLFVQFSNRGEVLFEYDSL